MANPLNFKDRFPPSDDNLSIYENFNDEKKEKRNKIFEKILNIFCTCICLNEGE